MTVEKYLLQRSFLQPSACSISSTLNSSWKDIRPIRATESRLVKCKGGYTHCHEALGNVNRDTEHFKETGNAGGEDG